MNLEEMKVQFDAIRKMCLLEVATNLKSLIKFVYNNQEKGPIITEVLKNIKNAEEKPKWGALANEYVLSQKKKSLPVKKY